MDAALDWSWIERLTRLFELCRVDSSETAVVLSDLHTEAALRDSCQLALRRLTQEVVSVGVPDAGPDRQDTDVLAIPAVLAVVGAADFVVDCTRGGLAGSHLLAGALGQGARVLAVGDAFSLGLFAPHAELKSRVEAGLELLDEAETVVLGSGGAGAGAGGGVDIDGVSSEMETKLTIAAWSASVRGTWGSSGEPVSISRWPGGVVYLNVARGGEAGGTDGTAAASGVITLLPGDLNLASGTYLHSKIRLVIEAGVVAEVEGTGDGVSLISSQFEAVLAENPDGSALSSVGCGMMLPSKLPKFFSVQAANSLLAPADFPADLATVNLAGVCFVVFGDHYDDQRSAQNGMVFAMRSASLSCLGSAWKGSAASTALVSSGELQGSLAPSVYEIASRG